MKTLYIGIIFMVFLNSCGKEEFEKSKNESIDLNDAIEMAEKRKKSDPKASGGNKCLLDFQTKISELFSAEEVVKLTGFSNDNLEIKLNDRSKNLSNHELMYRFKNKRKGHLEGFKHEVELPDLVKIKSIEAMSQEKFENAYRAITEEEMQNAREVLNEVVEGNIEDPDAKAAMEKAKESNVDNEQIKKTGTALTGMFKKVSESYIPIYGLGDKAVWNTYTKELVVLKNGVKFEIQTDVSNELQVNQDLAVQIAEIILDKCK